MEKFLSKYAFWLIQFIGWTLFWALILYDSDVQRTVGGCFYYMIGRVVECVIATAFLRWALKKMYFEIAIFKFANFLKFLISFILSALLITVLGEISSVIRNFLLEPMPGREHRDFVISFGMKSTLIAIWAIAYFTVLLFRKLNRQRIEKLEISANLRQEQLKLLRGQINLTFLVGCLDNIKRLSRNDVPLARNLLTILSDLLRYSLTNTELDVVNLNEELSMLAHYVVLVNIQTDNHIDLFKKIESDTLEIHIPPMMLLSLIQHTNNVIMTVSKEKREVRISISEQNGKIIIELQTIGKFPNVLVEVENRLRELSKRILILYGTPGNLSVYGENNQITSTFVFPIYRNSLEKGA